MAKLTCGNAPRECEKNGDIISNTRPWPKEVYVFAFFALFAKLCCFPMFSWFFLFVFKQDMFETADSTGL